MRTDEKKCKQFSATDPSLSHFLGGHESLDELARGKKSHSYWGMPLLEEKQLRAIDRYAEVTGSYGMKVAVNPWFVAGYSIAAVEA